MLEKKEDSPMSGENELFQPDSPGAPAGHDQNHPPPELEEENAPLPAEF
jgi:hypothetical protein